MDISDISALVTQIISNCGFPIAAFVMMLRLHMQESANWQQALERNSDVIEKLSSAISGKGGEKDAK